MFFAEPAAAFAHLRCASRAGSPSCAGAAPSDNAWAREPVAAARDLLPKPSPPDPHAPGPFAFADAAPWSST